MTSMSFVVNAEERQAILDEFGKTEQELEETVEIIRSWFETQLHLPETPSENMIKSFIILNEFDIELTKERFDKYYTCRSTMPQIYDYSNPSSHEMEVAADSCYIIPLPKLVDNKHGVVVFKEHAHVPQELDGHWWTGAIINMFEVKMQEGFFLDTIFIYDHQHLSMNHIFKLTPSVLMNCLSILEKSFNDKVKVFHLINNPPALQLLLKICKPFLKQALFDKFHIHDSAESLAEYVPIEILPKDYGGQEKSLDELQGLWLAKQKEYQEHFDKLDDLKVDETLRSSPETTAFSILFPNFSKLFVK